MNARIKEETCQRSDASACWPLRIWRRRIKGWKMPENTVSVTRPGLWGNPFGVHPEDGGQAAAVKMFEDWLSDEPGSGYAQTEPERRDWIRRNIHVLRGKNLACYCKPGTPCHADVLIRLANEKSAGTASK